MIRQLIGDISEEEVKNQYLQDGYIPSSGMRVDKEWAAFKGLCPFWV